MTDEERIQACKEIAERMYNAGMGWNFDALMKLTTPEIQAARALRFNERMIELPPIRRGVLDRYQDRRQKWRRR